MAVGETDVQFSLAFRDASTGVQGAGCRGVAAAPVYGGEGRAKRMWTLYKDLVTSVIPEYRQEGVHRYGGIFCLVKTKGLSPG